jgi:hypothetical protein
MTVEQPQMSRARGLRRSAAIAVAAVLVRGGWFGFRWLRRELGSQWRCQITVSGWRVDKGYYQEALPRDLQHPGAIYEGDSGCSDGERCYVVSVGLISDHLVPCDDYYSDA